MTTQASPDTRTTRRITGLTPSGELHLGNYLGAIRPLVSAQYDLDSTIFVSDLHAMTKPHDAARLGERTLEVAMLLLAAGIDPERTTLFIQSHVPEHTELHYLLECLTQYGEARRMIQFREKATGPDPVRLSLLTYPVLMAADILVYDIDEVPVGEDQRQHVEITRDIAERFNTRYSRTFTVP
jgi:tryptophanyl-tRNA synthetase